MDVVVSPETARLTSWRFGRAFWYWARRRLG
jgi:hypothetical protein